MPSAIMSKGGKGEPTIDELRAKLGWTPPYDPRFPNTNQTRYVNKWAMFALTLIYGQCFNHQWCQRNCYQNYLDFHRCQKVKGENYEPCNYFQRVYKALCPNDWVCYSLTVYVYVGWLTRPFLLCCLMRPFAYATICLCDHLLMRPFAYATICLCDHLSLQYEHWDEQREAGIFPRKNLSDDQGTGHLSLS